MKGQLALDLPVRPALSREDFFVSPANALALASLDAWRGWPRGKMVLVGPRGSGKTHLAHVWAAQTGAELVPAAALATLDLPALAANGAVAVEDADGIAGDAEAEEALFHLHNLLIERGGVLLITAASPPRDWGLRLPDLKSRMQAAAVTRLEPPDDALLSAMLVKLFGDRQIAVPSMLVPWLVARMDRSCDAARALVAALDARSLAERRPISRQMAADLLGTAGSE
ncbi:DnaA ATPase domain-containing protein [Rhodobacter sp. CZR27]|uniref:DnaA ATPase domain-containing protein n=1 Tax=Rhodobacter sp. CZR27 TaxID=2033869 RepID=UPI000BBEDD8F|nr:DnaA/Hda family protein [Rhodobacter sp. CZR27]